MSYNLLRFKNFIDEDVCNKLNIWVDRGVRNNWLDKGISEGSGWAYDKRLTTRAYADRFEYPEIAYEVQDKITKFLNITKFKKSVNGGGKDGIVVSSTLPGGDVYDHIDPMEQQGLHVLRCNILTRKSDFGAQLYIEDDYIDIEVGELHCYLPSSIRHRVTQAEGTKSRIMWMFGYQMSIQQFSDICWIKNYKKEKKSNIEKINIESFGELPDPRDYSRVA